MRVKISTIISTLLFSIIYSQNLSITGYVKGAKNGNILVGANVYIVGTSLGASAREDGQYKINNVKPGTYSVKASYIGYVTVEDSVTITDTDINLDFNLNYTTIEGKEVTVTAQAKGQMDAINRQLNARSIVNIISSDRIQELPDANAAESVARVPGVSIKREGGEGNKVVIRGLSPKYNAITVEGTRLPSTDPDDRSTDLSMISQYVLDGIEVTKAGTPDQDADVLGGTVNFKLKRAKPGLHFNFIGQGIHNGLKDTYEDNKLVFDISNRFWKDRIGVLAQIDLEKRNRSSNELGSSYSRDGSTENADSPGQLRLTGLNLADILRDNKRRNSLIVVDTKIPDRGILSDGSISFTSLKSSINKDISTCGINYSLTGGDKSHNTGITDNDIKIRTNTLRFKQTLYYNFHLESFYSTSIAQNNSFIKNFNFFDGFAFKESPFGVGIDRIQEITTNDTSNILFRGYSYNMAKSKETEQTYGINLEYDFRISSNFSGKIKFGTKERTKSRNFDQNNENGDISEIDAMCGMTNEFPEYFSEYIGLCGSQAITRIPFYPFIDYKYQSGNFFNGRYSMGPKANINLMNDIFHYFKKNWNQYNSSVAAPEMVVHVLHETLSILYDYEGEENYKADYLMIDMNLGEKLNIITGARIEKNITRYQSYRAWASVIPSFVFLGDSTLQNRGNEYILPALFIRYKPVSWLNIRFASTNTLTRPNYTDILPLYYVSTGSQSIDYRNTGLEPGKSENLDFSIAFNQKHLGLFSIARFEKNISGLIYSSGRRYVDDPIKYGLTDNLKSYMINDYKTNNPYAVKLRGWEFDYQTRFWYLPGPLSGLVLNANYTISESEVKYPRTEIHFEIDFGPPLVAETINIDSFYVDRLIDQPNEIFNLSIGYDYKGFSVRLSVLSKSDIFMQTNFWKELRQTTDNYTRWDLSVKQKLPINGLEIFLNMNNITKAVDKNRYHTSNSLALEQHYGKTIDLGLKYSF